MKKRRRPTRPPPVAVRSGGENAPAIAQGTPPPPRRQSPPPRIESVQRRSLAVTFAAVGLFGSVAAAGIVGMTLISRWASSDDAMPWSIAGLSVGIVGVAGVCFALRRKDVRTLPYVLGIFRDAIPIFLALAAVNGAIAFELSRTPAVDAEAQLRQQVERLSAERKNLMKSLFAAGKYETQTGALQTQLREREASLGAVESERTRLREELETLKGKLAVAETRTASEKESVQVRAELEAKAQRLALLESTQRETRQELQAIRDDLRRGRRVTDARLIKALATIPAEEPTPSRQEPTSARGAGADSANR